MATVKFLLATILLVFVTSRPTSALPALNRREMNLQRVLPAPYQKPLPDCENQLLQIDRAVLLSSSPFQPGQTLVIEASGTLLEEVEKGASVALGLTKGLDTIWAMTVDLYDKIRDVTSSFNKGKIGLEAPMVLPKQILAGKYHLEGTVYVKDSGQAACRIGKDVHNIHDSEV